jgi:peptidoglycan hydrolase CwlO-like protein
MPKILVGISILLMALTLVFGFLNTNKVRALRNELVTTSSARDVANRGRIASERKLKAEEKELNDAKAKIADAEAKAGNAETELKKAQTEKSETQAKLQSSETQIADLQKQIADVTAGVGTGGDPTAVPPNEAQAALQDAKKQLEAAEQEKAVLADKLKAAQDQVAALQKEKKRRSSRKQAPGVHGTVLAVNQAYNFVVLGIGEQQGVAPNSEMLVMRSGALIGKIRISSVEPTTSIGDIVTSSLPRGVEVQPGDTVVYAGNPNS